MTATDNWLPLDDPENSARWISEQDNDTLWEELDTVIHFIAQASRAAGEGHADAVEDVGHAIRLAGQIMNVLKEKS